MKKRLHAKREADVQSDHLHTETQCLKLIAISDRRFSFAFVIYSNFFFLLLHNNNGFSMVLKLKNFYVPVETMMKDTIFEMHWNFTLQIDKHIAGIVSWELILNINGVDFYLGIVASLSELLAAFKQCCAVSINATKASRTSILCRDIATGNCIS